MNVVLGIDLGTTNSVVSVSEGGDVPRVLPDADGNLLIPSVVSFHPAGDVLVGHAARERRLLDAKNTVYSVKRLIGRPFRSPEVRRAQERFPFELCEGPTQGVLVKARGETYTLPEISAFVLREVRRIAETAMNQHCTQAVVTVPANFNELQRSATKAAGRVAGLEVLRILNEPTAAALAYGYGKGAHERIAVFDLGGGTFDITILELAGDVFEVLSTAGDTFLGGDDIDLLIAEKMADAFLKHHRFDPRSDAQAYERLRAAAEWAKCQLSNEPEVQLRVEELAYGDGGASLDLTFGMTRQALERLVQPLIARAFDVCEDAMRVAGVRPTQLDNVILVGGSTRMPLVSSMVAEYFGREPLTNIDPDLVVAEGAALQAAALAPRSDLSGPKRLAKVALKKVSRADLRKLKERREELKKEAAAARPAQPAFQPSRPAALWEQMDELPTRVGTVDDQLTRPGPSAHQEITAVGTSTDAETRAVASIIESFEEPTTGARAKGSASSEPVPPPPTAASAQSYDEVVRSSAPPAAMPAEPTKTRRRGAPQGGDTLGSGAGGLSVPDYDDLGETKPVTATDMADAVVATAPPIPVGTPEPPAPPIPVRTPEPPAPPEPPMFPPTPATPSQPDPPRPPPRPSQPSPRQPQGPPAQPPVPQKPMFPTPQVREPVAAPLLLDVTPHTLGIETVAGYCEPVIKRNATIPVEQTRLFVTGSDDQDTVSVRIFQGESRRLDENQPLGEIQLSGLRKAARGEVKIEVTFLMDADGTLGVVAVDKETGQQQIVRIKLVGGVDDAEIQRMKQRQASMMGE